MNCHRTSMLITALMLAPMGGSLSAQVVAPSVELLAVLSAGSNDAGEGFKTKDLLARPQITLKNSGTDRLDIRPDPNWRSLADGTTHPARWSIPQTGAQQDMNGVFALDKAATLTFMAEGEFERPGTHITSLAVSAGDGPARRFSLAVTRTVAGVPDNLFVAPKPARIGVGLFDLTTPIPAVLQVSAHNSTNESIPIGAPTLLRFSILDGDTEAPVASGQSPTVQASNCAGVLLPKQDCPLVITIPAGLSAGRYATEVALSGPGGGRASANVRLDVRLSAWLAALLVAAGALGGYLLVIWRERGRATLDHRIAIAEAQVRISRLIGGAHSPTVRSRARGLLDSIRIVEDTIVAGGDPTSSLADLGVRYETLVTADQMIAQADKIEPRELLASLLSRLTAELQTDQWTAAKVKAAIDPLQSGVGSFAELSTEAINLKTALDQLRPIANTLPSDCLPSLAAASEALANAVVPVSVDNVAEPPTDLKTRAAGLRTATAKLRAVPRDALAALLPLIEAALAKNPADPAPLKDLRSSLKALPDSGSVSAATAGPLLGRAVKLGLLAPHLQVETAGAGDTQLPRVLQGDAASVLMLDFNPFLFGIGQMVPPDKLRRARVAWSLVTNAIVLIGIGLSGTLVLWVPNSSWGTATDIVTALLAGAGTRLAIGTMPR